MWKILANETGIIIGILGLLPIIIDLLAKDKNRTRRVIFGILCLCGVLLIANYINLNYIHKSPETVKVPNVEGLTYENAQILIREKGLNENPFVIGNQPLSYDMEVINQFPAASAEVKVGSKVSLFFIAMESSGQGEQTGETDRESIEIVDNTIIHLDDSSNNISGSLSLHITSHEQSKGFYYEDPNPDEPGSYWIIDLPAGLSGTFTYSRELTEHEKENWMHGGKLYDASGNEVGSEGNYPTFWSNPNGMFAMGFPPNLPAGTYRYELYQFIDGQYVEDSFIFTI